MNRFAQAIDWQKLAAGAVVATGLVAGSFLLRPERETLDDLTVRTDYLSNDSLFVDAVLMLKPYRSWSEKDFDTMVRSCDALAFYAQRAGADDVTSPDLRIQLYALHEKRVIDSSLAKLVDIVCRNMPEERAVANDNKDALLTVVDTYVDSVQNDCRDRARFIGADGPRRGIRGGV